MSEVNCALHIFFRVLENKQERRSESVVIGLSVQIVIRNKDLHRK